MKTSFIAPAVLAGLLSVALTYARPVQGNFDLQARNVVDSAYDALYIRDLEAEIFELEARDGTKPSAGTVATPPVPKANAVSSASNANSRPGQHHRRPEEISIDVDTNGNLPGGDEKITLDFDQPRGHHSHNINGQTGTQQQNALPLQQKTRVQSPPPPVKKSPTQKQQPQQGLPVNKPKPQAHPNPRPQTQTQQQRQGAHQIPGSKPAGSPTKPPLNTQPNGVTGNTNPNARTGAGQHRQRRPEEITIDVDNNGSLPGG
ncbi:hypothetical protein H0H93_003417, partial [Arthromyces matolae]